MSQLFPRLSSQNHLSMALNLASKPLIFPLLLTLLSVTSAILSEEEEEWTSATATFINSIHLHAGGACGYRNLTKYVSSDKVAAVSGAIFGHGEACGACFAVRCVDHPLWCRPGSPSVIVTATDYCAPNYALPSDFGGWCNRPLHHFTMSIPAFAAISELQADVVPVQYRRAKCGKVDSRGMRFTMSGMGHFVQVLVTNVGSDGVVGGVRVKGRRTGWVEMGRNWGQNWQCNAELRGQALSFEVRDGGGRSVASYDVAPANWRFGQTYEGKQFQR